LCKDEIDELVKQGHRVANRGGTVIQAMPKWSSLFAEEKKVI